jgi:hypothetical protein
LDNGNLLRAGRDSIEIRDWNNNLVWSYDLSGNGYDQHHDIEPLPNGNILCLLHDIYTSSYMTQQGRMPSLLTSPTFKLDRVVELQPQGTNDAQLIWEWRMIDHIVQGFDDTKPNYGVIASHPELLDINHDEGHALDWSHCNGIDYHSQRDQVLITARHLNEVYIVDHSTTTQEAASHSGGTSGKGGDYLWRWGNPQLYGQGTTADKKLFKPHDAKWVEQGYLDEDKISVFNNLGSQSLSYSSVHLLDAPFEEGEYVIDGGKFAPLDYDWSWDGSILGEPFFEFKKSGMQSQPNGNLLICQTSKARISEITKSGNLVWSYRSPVTGYNTIANQFQLDVENTSIFRGERYPTNYPGFSGLTLVGTEIIESVNANSESCVNVLSNTEAIQDKNQLIVSAEFENLIHFNRSLVFADVTIYDLTGKVVLQQTSVRVNSLEINAPTGMYLILIREKDQSYSQRIILQ